MVKSIAKKSRSVRTSVMLPQESYERVQALADANQVSSAWIIRHAVIKLLRDQTSQLQLPLPEKDL